jgi:hypothetical protein
MEGWGSGEVSSLSQPRQISSTVKANSKTRSLHGREKSNHPDFISLWFIGRGHAIHLRAGHMRRAVNFWYDLRKNFTSLFA